MKKKSIIFILLLVSVFIVGYISFNLFNNKKDKSVKDNNTVKNNNNIEYISVDELKNGRYDSNKIKEYKYNNISYDNDLSVIIPSVDKINEISVKGV